jgi:hypothetical protein
MRFYLLILFFVTFTFSNTPINHKYTVDGVYTYQDVLERLNFASKRSVLGSSDLLSISRKWYIVDKPYLEIIEHIKLNAITDGFSTISGDNYVYFYPIDTSKVDTVKPPKVYRYYSDYQKKYFETTSQVEYLNYPLIDSLLILEKQELSKVRKLKVTILGYTKNYLKENGIQLTQPILQYNIPKTVSYTPIMLMLDNVDTEYNFNREMIFFVNSDSINTIRFGTETRREQGSTQSNGMVTTQYESVYDGLTINIIDSVYTANYRIEQTELFTKGLIGEVVTASASISYNSINMLFPFKKFRLPRKKKTENTTFSVEILIDDITERGSNEQ